LYVTFTAALLVFIKVSAILPLPLPAGLEMFATAFLVHAKALLPLIPVTPVAGA
jgi:hypothetical protein